MRFIFTPQLSDYLKKKGKRTISVEIATSDHSDFDVSELYLRLVKDDFADYLVDKKRYRRKEAENGAGSVLLPPYVLEYEETVTFSIKKILWFHKITMEGISL